LLYWILEQNFTVGPTSSRNYILGPTDVTARIES
jgi:hypothetical protein